MNSKSRISFYMISIIIITTGTISGIMWMDILDTSQNQEVWIEVSKPDNQGLQSAKLDQILIWIKKHNIPIDSLVIIKDDKLVMEEYPSLDEKIVLLQSNSDPKHMIASCTKSITSALVGIAIDKGYINSVNEKVLDFFPDYIDSIGPIDARKEMMTIEDLLTMRTGLDWWQPGSLSPDHSDPNNNGDQMWNSPDFIRYTLSQPMVHNPGEGFAYSGGASHLLSAIIERTTGKSTLEFAQENLFEKIGITDIYWPRAAEGTFVGAGGVLLSSVDMAKFGYLFLNDGKWEGEQIISREWVKNSTSTHHYHSESSGYGYQWWTRPKEGFYYALGANCQRIIVLPNQNMVVVFTANIPTYPDPEMALLDHIINALYDKEEFSKYDFTMNYSPGMRIDERSEISGPLSNSSGYVNVYNGKWPMLKYTVTWKNVSPVMNLQGEVNSYIQDFTSRNPSVDYLRVENVYNSTKDSHEMVYQEFQMIEQETSLWGVISSWYCEETSRSFIFLYYDLDVDLIKNFNNYISSFTCH